MDGAYAESIVKRRNGAIISLYKALIILGDIILLSLPFLFPQAFGILILLFFVGVGATVYAMPLFNVEYEVVYVNGQFDFARILNGSRRKLMLRMDFDSAEIMAPESSKEIEHYKNNTHMHVCSFVSGDPAAKNYALVGKDSKGNMTMALFQPSEKMLGLIKGNPIYRRKYSEI